MLTRILLAALLAGVLAGVFASVAQTYHVTPLILAAESYGAGADKPHVEGDHSHKTSAALEEGASAGWERLASTTLANIITAIAFSLILTAGVLLTKSNLDFRSGLVWGGCGFIAFVLAPNYGLLPILPGTNAADLFERQAWWVATAVATSGALLIFAFRQKLLWMLAGLALLVAPHIYGAPLPEENDSLVPANIAAEFVMATLVTSLLFWVVLGAALGIFVSCATRPQTSAAS